MPSLGGATTAAAACAPLRRRSTCAAAIPNHTTTAAAASAAPTTFKYVEIEVQTTGYQVADNGSGTGLKSGISVHDLMPQLRQLVAESGVREGFVNVLSRHTTTAVTINEHEGRLLFDIERFLQRLAPATDRYDHNDLHLRSGPPDWPGGDEAWRKQEPINAHSHLLSMVLGNSETVPISGGELKTGVWQSVMLVELDGPRKRSVGVQIVGVGGGVGGGGEGAGGASS